jgi:peptidoglycan/LPS O-acetylase OafA/YrhL
MERRHDLDWLRVCAVLLLLPFHSARVFDPFEDFYVRSAATSEPVFWSVIAFISVWQMQLLFVLAGAASWYAFGRRSVHEYRAERVKRLLVPFLFGLVVIVPIQSYLAIVWRGGSASIPAFTVDYWGMQRELVGYDGGFTPGHLWFIAYLFLYSLVAAPLFARWHARTGPKRWVRWYLFLIPLAVFVGDALPWPEDGPQNLFYSFALFVAGFLLVSEPRLEEAVDRAWRWLAAVAGLSVAVLLWSWVSGTWDRLEDDGPVSALLDLGQATVMWVVVLALLALGKRFLSFETPFLRWANEGAYPIYLLHQSVIIVVAYLVLTAWEAPALAGFMVVATASLVVTVVTYELLVKPWSPTRFLFGMKPLPVRGANGGRARVAVGGARMPATDGSPRA